jgi:uncharacterized damage-inducible protein DinB
MTEVERTIPPLTGNERETLGAYLDYQRDTLVWKMEGLSDDDLRRSVVPSGWPLLGLVKHLAYVERWWFQDRFAGEDATYPWTDEDPDADWRIEPEDTTAGILELYRAECDRNRAIVAAAGSLDQVAAHGGRRGPMNLRWIMAHMIEETARHCGHADIARELIDGATGE